MKSLHILYTIYLTCNAKCFTMYVQLNKENDMSAKEQTIKMTYNRQVITPSDFDPTNGNPLLMTAWFKARDGKWYTVPPKNEEHGCDPDTLVKWAAQWDI